MLDSGVEMGMIMIADYQTVQAVHVLVVHGIAVEDRGK
jgi:hypothetical protein